MDSIKIKKIAKIIPIVFCTDHAYSKYALVAIQSIIENRKIEDDINYKIFVFHDDELPKSDIDLFERLKFDNLSVECKNVGHLLDSKSLYSRAHYSKQMFYRWLIPEVLSEFEKVIYLDCDLVTLSNIEELYDIDLAGNIVGAVKDDVKKDRVHYYIEKELHLKKDKYINSGVLLIDVKKFNEEGVKEKCLKLLEKHSVFSCPDQDALNIVLEDKILLLDEKWNIQWGNLEDDYIEDDIKVLHFTTDVKPWKSNGANISLACHFWRYAEKTECYQELLENSKLNKKSSKKPKKMKKNRFLRFILLPFRILRKFFVGWRDVGFKNSLHEIWFEIKYIFYRNFRKR